MMSKKIDRFLFLKVFASSLMGLVDRGYLSLSRGDSDGTTIAMNEEREMEFGFLCSLVQPFVEGVWVSEW